MWPNTKRSENSKWKSNLILYFLLWSPFFNFDPQVFKLYENPKRGDEIQRGDRTGCWTGEDFTEKFLVWSTSLKVNLQRSIIHMLFIESWHIFIQLPIYKVEFNLWQQPENLFVALNCEIQAWRVKKRENWVIQPIWESKPLNSKLLGRPPKVLRRHWQLHTTSYHCWIVLMAGAI